jgi:hypothetical protein
MIFSHARFLIQFDILLRRFARLLRPVVPIINKDNVDVVCDDNSMQGRTQAFSFFFSLKRRIPLFQRAREGFHNYFRFSKGDPNLKMRYFYPIFGIFIFFIFTKVGVSTPGTPL